MRNPFRISFFHPKFCINRLVGADHYKPKLRISTNLRSWTKFASSEHANENCTKIAQILRHMDESCTKIARIASDEKCAEIARKIARKIQSGQLRPLQVRYGALLSKADPHCAVALLGEVPPWGVMLPLGDHGWFMHTTLSQRTIGMPFDFSSDLGTWGGAPSLKIL